MSEPIAPPSDELDALLPDYPNIETVVGVIAMPDEKTGRTMQMPIARMMIPPEVEGPIDWPDKIMLATAHSAAGKIFLILDDQNEPLLAFDWTVGVDDAQALFARDGKFLIEIWTVSKKHAAIFDKDGYRRATHVMPITKADYQVARDWTAPNTTTREIGLG